jgi:hypothetical protein
VVEGARLESVFRGNSNVGSNPTLSARFVFFNLRIVDTDATASPHTAKTPQAQKPGMPQLVFISRRPDRLLRKKLRSKGTKNSWPSASDEGGYDACCQNNEGAKALLKAPSHQSVPPVTA